MLGLSGVRELEVESSLAVWGFAGFSGRRHWVSGLGLFRIPEGLV